MRRKEVHNIIPNGPSILAPCLVVLKLPIIDAALFSSTSSNCKYSIDKIFFYLKKRTKCSEIVLNFIFNKPKKKRKT